MPKIRKKKPVGRDVYELTLDRLRLCFDRFDKVVVSFSGGKDSTVCLNLALEVARERGRLPLDVAHFDEEAIPPETVDYVRRVSRLPDVRLRWLCLPVKHRNACSRRSPWWHPWAPEDRGRWVRDLPPEAEADAPGFARQPIPECNGILWPPSCGTVCVVLGLRADESINRYQAIACKQGFEAFLAGDSARHVTRASPIYDWASEDVWLAPHLRGWDYNGAYDQMRRAGIPLSVQRCAPPFGEQPLRCLWMFKTCWPCLWARMCDRVPGAATAARYCETELYRDVAGMTRLAPTWKDEANRLLGKFSGDARRKTARSVLGFLAQHGRHSDRPLPDDEPDPDSLLSWRVICKAVGGGDLKGRQLNKTVARLNSARRKIREATRYGGED